MEQHFDETVKTHLSLNTLTDQWSEQRIFNQLAAEKRNMFDSTSVYI